MLSGQRLFTAVCNGLIVSKPGFTDYRMDCGGDVYCSTPSKEVEAELGANLKKNNKKHCSPSRDICGSAVV